MKFARHFLLLLCLSALAGAAWVGHRPADVSGVGLPPPNPGESPAAGQRTRDLLDDLRQAAIKRSGLVEISEADLNRHLMTTLEGKLPDPAARWVSFERLALDLEPGIAHLTLVWNAWGHQSTATIGLTVERKDDAFRVAVVGGSYGHLAVRRGMMRPLEPALARLGEALAADIQALFQMNQVHIGKDKLVLDPRFL